MHLQRDDDILPAYHGRIADFLDRDVALDAAQLLQQHLGPVAAEADLRTKVARCTNAGTGMQMLTDTSSST